MLILLALFALVSFVLLVLQAVHKLSLSSPSVVYPAILLFPAWLIFVLGTLGEMLTQMLAGGLSALLPVLGQCFTHLFPAVLFLTIFIKFNLFPGGRDPARRLALCGAVMAVWFQAVSVFVMITAVVVSGPFLDAIVQTVGTMGLGLFLLLMLCPFGFIVAIPIWGAALIATTSILVAASICGPLCTASAVVCANAAFRMGRQAGGVRWFHLVLALIPAVNFVLMLYLLLRKPVPMT